MTQKETSYKLSLSGGKITVKEQLVSEEIARKIMTLIMGGMIGTEASDDGEARPAINSGSNTLSNGSLTPKTFMAQKKPSSEIERVTCLAYYLAHHRNVPAFKTKDLTKLNREAAQADFSNATAFARNADGAGYLAKAGGGSKQITVLGEAVVDALPDREKVKAAIEANKSGRKRRTAKRTRKATK